jgi:transcription elongation factor GreA
MKDQILKNLRGEIEKIQYELNVELPKEIRFARELGDITENAEYHAAKERQSYLQARLAQLQDRYRQLGMLDFSKIPKDRIGLGSRVTVTDLDTGEEKTYELVIAEEADAAVGKISVSSPIGRALLGKKAGDEVTVQAPSGVRELEILSFNTAFDRFESES